MDISFLFPSSWSKTIVLCCWIEWKNRGQTDFQEINLFFHYSVQSQYCKSSDISPTKHLRKLAVLPGRLYLLSRTFLESYHINNSALGLYTAGHHYSIGVHNWMSLAQLVLLQTLIWSVVCVSSLPSHFQLWNSLSQYAFNSLSQNAASGPSFFSWVSEFVAFITNLQIKFCAG